jgi:hypothetical protein
VFILEVAIMSNYVWTEEQIQAAIKKGESKSQEKWLGADSFKIGKTRDINNKKAESSDYRQLMATLVQRKHAFDNNEDATSLHYKISFNWSRSNGSISSFLIPPDWSKSIQPIYEALLGTGLKSVPPIFALLRVARCLGRPLTQTDKQSAEENRALWSVIRFSIAAFQCTGELELAPSHREALGKEQSKILLLFISDLILMHEVFEKGWSEIQPFYPDRSFEEFFTELLQDYSVATLIRIAQAHDSGYQGGGYRAMLKKLNVITPILANTGSLLRKKGYRELIDEDPLKALGMDYGLSRDHTKEAVKAIRSIIRSNDVEGSLMEKILLIELLSQSRDPTISDAALGFVDAQQESFTQKKRRIRRIAEKPSKPD